MRAPTYTGSKPVSLIGPARPHGIFGLGAIASIGAYRIIIEALGQELYDIDKGWALPEE